MDNFNLKKFLVENKLTYNSRLLTEGIDEEEDQDTLIELKPIKYTGQQIPSGANYRIVYMYSDTPEYEMFTRNEPTDSDMILFLKIAPNHLKKGDAILALDGADKLVNYIKLKDSAARIARPGDLSPMTV